MTTILYYLSIPIGAAVFVFIMWYLYKGYQHFSKQLDEEEQDEWSGYL